LTPTQGLARGMAVTDTGGPLQAPVGQAILSRMFDAFGNAIDRQPAPTAVQWRSVHRAPPPLERRSTKSEISRPASRSLMCSCRWNAAARRDCSAGPGWSKPCCSPK